MEKYDLYSKIYPLHKTWHILSDNMHYIVLNANDFFGYATVDAVKLYSQDFKWAFYIIENYGISGLHAVMAYIEDRLPVPERQTETFKIAYKKIEDLKPLVFSKIDDWSIEFCQKVLSQHTKENPMKASRAEQKKV